MKVLDGLAALCAMVTLLDAGQLELAAPISQYLPAEFPGITVRHALAHTSGLPFCSQVELDAGGGTELFADSSFKHYRDTGDDCVYDATDLTHATESYATARVIANPGESWQPGTTRTPESTSSDA